MKKFWSWNKLHLLVDIMVFSIFMYFIFFVPLPYWVSVLAAIGAFRSFIDLYKRYRDKNF